MLRPTVFICLVATAASLTGSARPLGRGPLSRGQRSANPLAQQLVAAARWGGTVTPLRAWEPQVDQASGQTYYMNSETGETQWEAPQQQGWAASGEPAEPKWTIDCFAGVAGFSGVAGFKADNKFGDREFRLEYEREGRPCQLPYRVGAGEEKMLSR